MRWTRYGLVMVLVASTAVWGAAPAAAACHAFTVQVDPADPTEGSPVEVTVERDAAVVPSSVRVRTVAGSAGPGEDYVELDERVEFSSGTTQTVTVETLQDTADEPDETLTVELSEAEGCEVNQNFQYGPPATITIRDDDTATTTTQPTTTAAPTTEQQPTTTTESGSTESGSTGSGAETTEGTTTTTALEGPTTTTSSSTSSTTTLLGIDEEAVSDDAEDDDGGLSPWALVALVLALGVGGAAAYLGVRRRAGP